MNRSSKYSSLVLLILLSTQFVSQNAQAFINTFVGCVLFGQDCYNHDGDGLIGCAPEVVNGNIQAVDRTVTELSQNELKSSAGFKEMVSKASAMDTQHKVEYYFNQLGISSEKEAIDFISSREPNSKYVNALSKNTGLTTEQAKLVSERLSVALLGSQK